MINIPYYETSYFALSNFSPHQIIIDGIIYPTIEHAYQALKFSDQKIAEEIRSSKSPLEAFKLGRKYKESRMPDWDDLKLNVMRKLLKEKITQHEEIKSLLLSTKGLEIVEESGDDKFWGCGADKTGQNNLGKLWMEIREEILS